MQVQLENGSTLRVYSAKRGPMSILGTMVYPHSHLCMSLKKNWQLGRQRANSHQAGIVKSRVDHNEQGIETKTCQKYRKQVVGKINEDLEWIWDPWSYVENVINEIPR